MRRIRNNINVDDQEVGRWLLSYADFITLLFAFFVVMYSISQVNVSKYKILSQSLEGIFDRRPNKSDIIIIEKPELNIKPNAHDQIEQPELNNSDQETGQIDSENFATAEAFKDLEKGLEASLGDLIDQNLAEINSDASWINIVLKSALLFPSGSDLLNSESEPLMEEVAKHLNSNRQLILVHGHTDNIPINTEKFPSNWELSSARGVAVVRKLQNLNIQPNRLSVEGHGEYLPVADNSSEDGRRENRRVVIAISRKQQVVELVTKADDSSISEQREVGDNLLSEVSETAAEKDREPKYEIIKLPGGGILIRGKESPQKEKAKKEKDKSGNEEN